MRAVAGVVLAVVGVSIVLVALGDQPMPRRTPWWWRYGRPAALVALGAALILTGAGVAAGASSTR